MTDPSTPSFFVCIFEARQVVRECQNVPFSHVQLQKYYHQTLNCAILHLHSNRCIFMSHITFENGNNFLGFSIVKKVAKKNYQFIPISQQQIFQWKRVQVHRANHIQRLKSAHLLCRKYEMYYLGKGYVLCITLSSRHSYHAAKIEYDHKQNWGLRTTKNPSHFLIADTHTK